MLKPGMFIKWNRDRTIEDDQYFGIVVERAHIYYKIKWLRFTNDNEFRSSFIEKRFFNQCEHIKVIK